MGKDFQSRDDRAEGADVGETSVNLFADRFSIRWDDMMGCYRVSVPRLSADGERIEVVRVDALRARLVEMELHEDLPDSFDQGYMRAWRDVARWLEAFPSSTGSLANDVPESAARDSQPKEM